MNKIEDRVRDGLLQAAEHLPESVTIAQLEEGSHGRPNRRGPGVAIAAAAVVVLVFGGASLLSNPSSGGPASDPTDPIQSSNEALLPESFNSEFQERLLSDAEVTYEELEEAMDSWIVCVEDAGFVNVYGLVKPSGESEFGIAQGLMTELEQAESRRVIEDCREEFFAQVDTFYALTHPEVSGDPYTEATSSVLADCMIEDGVPLGEVPVGLPAWQDVLAELGDEAWVAFRECETQLEGSG